MPITPLIIFHVIGAVLGVLSGFAAMLFRKGSGLHGAAGTVFFVSMLIMAGTGLYLSTVVHPVRINAVAASLTLYLVLTSWVAAKRREKRVNAFDAGALVWIVVVGFIAAIAAKDAAGYLVFAAVAFLFAAADVRMLVRGGVTGAQRIGRHLWRMCLALIFATLSLYPGQAKLFPPAMRNSVLPMLPAVFLIVSTIYWVVRTRRSSRMAVRT